MSKSKPFVEVKHGHHSTNRAPTPAEMTMAEELRRKIKAQAEVVAAANKELERLQALCTHTVSEDHAGLEYDVRECYACGKHQGLI